MSRTCKPPRRKCARDPILPLRRDLSDAGFRILRAIVSFLRSISSTFVSPGNRATQPHADRILGLNKGLLGSIPVRKANAWQVEWNCWEFYNFWFSSKRISDDRLGVIRRILQALGANEFLVSLRLIVGSRQFENLLSIPFDYSHSFSLLPLSLFYTLFHPFQTNHGDILWTHSITSILNLGRALDGTFSLLLNSKYYRFE